MDGIINELCSPKPLPIAKSLSSESLPNSSQPPSSKKQRRHSHFLAPRPPRAGMPLQSCGSADKRKRSLDKTLAILNATLNNGGRRPHKIRSSKDQHTACDVEMSLLPVADQPPSLQLVLHAPDSPVSEATGAVGSLNSSSSAPSICGSTDSTTQSVKGKQKPISIFEKLEVCHYADELKAAGKFREAHGHSKMFLYTIIKSHLTLDM